MPYPPQDDTWAWERLIVSKPEMAVCFTGWDQLGGFAWARILSRRGAQPTARLKSASAVLGWVAAMHKNKFSTICSRATFPYFR
jgi:hypothetical protein